MLQNFQFVHVNVVQLARILHYFCRCMNLNIEHPTYSLYKSELQNAKLLEVKMPPI